MAAPPPHPFQDASILDNNPRIKQKFTSRHDVRNLIASYNQLSISARNVPNSDLKHWFNSLQQKKRDIEDAENKAWQQREAAQKEGKDFSNTITGLELEIEQVKGDIRQVESSLRPSEQQLDEELNQFWTAGTNICGEERLMKSAFDYIKVAIVKDDPIVRDQYTTEWIEAIFHGLGAETFLKRVEQVTRIVHQPTALAPEEVIHELKKLPGSSLGPDPEVWTMESIKSFLVHVNRFLEETPQDSNDNDSFKLLSSPIRGQSPAPVISQGSDPKLLKDMESIEIDQLKEELVYEKQLVDSIRRDVLRNSLCHWDLGSGSAHDAARQLTHDKPTAPINQVPYFLPDVGYFLELADDFDDHPMKPRQPVSIDYLALIYQDSLDTQSGEKFITSHLPWVVSYLPQIISSSLATNRQALGLLFAFFDKCINTQLMGISRSCLFMGVAYLLQRSHDLRQAPLFQAFIDNAVSLKFGLPYGDWNPIDRLAFMWCVSRKKGKISGKLLPGDEDFNRWEDLTRELQSMNTPNFVDFLTNIKILNFLDQEDAGYKVLSVKSGSLSGRLVIMRAIGGEQFWVQQKTKIWYSRRGLEFRLGNANEDFALLIRPINSTELPWFPVVSRTLEEYLGFYYKKEIQRIVSKDAKERDKVGDVGSGSSSGAINDIEDMFCGSI